MRHNLLSSTALTTSTAGALAAMSLSAAAAPPAPYNWTGCYIGINAGGAWGHVDQSTTIPNVGFPTPFTRTFSDSGSDSSFTGGGQAGCNWQAAQYWLLGVEGDFNYAHLKRSQNFSAVFNGEDTIGRQETKLRWLATMRGRLGATWNATLIYVTGGLAFGDVNSTVNAQIIDPNGDSTATLSGSYSQIRTGWVIGGGIEHKLTNQWSAKIEYLHFDLGSFSYNVNQTRLVGNPVSPFIPTAWTANGSMNGDIVRVGVNYKFGP
jgi:outer membrane immunogenic protein